MPTIDVVEVLAEDSTTRQSLEKRFGYIRSVKDFGAVGDNIADDTDPIQAAIDWQTANDLRGVIFFPPGNYKTTSSLLLPNGALAQSYHFEGVGIESAIYGNFADYLFKRDTIASTTSGPVSWSRLQLTNTHATGGCIQCYCTHNATISQCLMAAYRCVTAGPGSFNMSVRDCHLLSGVIGAAVGGYGICGAAVIDACRVGGFDHGFRLSTRAAVHGCNAEQNRIGIAVGYDVDGGTANVTGIITSCETEANMIGIDVNSSNGLVIAGMGAFAEEFTIEGSLAISSITWSGGTATLTTTAPHGLTGTRGIHVSGCSPAGYNGSYMVTLTGASTMTYSIADPGAASATVPAYPSSAYAPLSTHGIRIRFGQHCLMTACSFGGPFTTAAAEWYGIAPTKMAVIGCSFVNSMPGKPAVDISVARNGLTFIQCDGVTHETTFSDLPASPVAGMEYDISDGTIAGGVWGGIVTGSGSTHCKVRYNGTNWTAVGK